MDVLVQYAFALMIKSKQYFYGGDDPIQGFDCSGFVQELMKAAGEIPAMSQKMSAISLFASFNLAVNGKQVEYATPGTLAFFGKDEHSIVHVGFCVSPYLMLEAGGGDSSTVTEQVAIDRNAFIKLRPIRYRKDFLCYIRPHYIEMTGGM